MVGNTRPGAWLTSSSSARGRRLLQYLESAFSPSRFKSSSGSTIATRQPPSPAVEPKNGTVPDIVDAGHGEELAGLLVDDALERQQIAVGLAGDAARHRILGGDGERVCLLDGGRSRIGCASTKRAMR
jgi:hypothetical protein